MERLNFARFLVAPSDPGGEASASIRQVNLFVSGNDPFSVLELATHVLLHAGWRIRDILRINLDVSGDEVEFTPLSPLVNEARIEGFAFEVLPSSADVHAGTEGEQRPTT